MTTDTDMKLDYVMVLKNLQTELDGMEGRRKKLLAAIASIGALVSEEEQTRLNLGDQPPPNPLPAGSGPLHAIPAGFFAGKTPTQAYRDLMAIRPGDYSAPQIADAFSAGGMTGKSRTEVLQHIHSVKKRERDRRERDLAAAP